MDNIDDNLNVMMLDDQVISNIDQLKELDQVSEGEISSIEGDIDDIFLHINNLKTQREAKEAIKCIKKAKRNKLKTN